MKFDHRDIMTRAWAKRHSLRIPFADALHIAWMEAKIAAARYNVYGQSFGASPVLIAACASHDRAGELEWMHKYRFDRLWRVKVA